VPCRLEHSHAGGSGGAQRITLYGVDYKDKPEAARAFLSSLEIPFGKINEGSRGPIQSIGGDRGTGNLRDRQQGIIRVHYAGPLNDQVVERLDPSCAGEVMPVPPVLCATLSRSPAL